MPRTTPAYPPEFTAEAVRLVGVPRPLPDPRSRGIHLRAAIDKRAICSFVKNACAGVNRVDPSMVPPKGARGSRKRLGWRIRSKQMTRPAGYMT
jgi:hypothetical protein